MTKEDLLTLLWQNADAYISGEELARRLSVSRTAVWKAIGQLREAGYNIESVSNRGYRLLSESDVLSEEGIRRHLKHQELELQVYKTITSTNTVLKALAAEGAPAGLALIAGEQTAGRGRMGRSFYSPADSGLYLSLLLRPNVSAVEATRLTACAAVAVAETIEELSGRPAQIKWVNDIFVDGRKVCGILTEASVDCENGMMHYVIIGLGVNTRVPAGDFPEELKGIAGAAFDANSIPELRCPGWRRTPRIRVLHLYLRGTGAALWCWENRSISSLRAEIPYPPRCSTWRRTTPCSSASPTAARQGSTPAR